MTLEIKCPKCESDHRLHECPTYSSLNLHDRWECAKSARICFICLEPNHRRVECKKPLCEACNGPHHISLHNYTSKRTDENYFAATSANMEVDRYTSTIPRSLLPIVPVTLCNDEHYVKCTTLLDSGSEINVMSLKCYQKLCLRGENVSLNVVGVGGVMSRVKSKKVKVMVKDSKQKEVEIDCIVLSQACGRMRGIDEEIIESCNKSSFQAQQLFRHSGEVDLIIGMSNPELHQQITMKKTNR